MVVVVKVGVLESVGSVHTFCANSIMGWCGGQFYWIQGDASAGQQGLSLPWHSEILDQ